ncbi:MAG TPA: N-acetylglucosamine-6-phosphate deacetylase [Firmicutes bacterium]|nr:N-acetylglucosamine-6-phosphate deacetylase [Bacillota bacterium]
MAVLFLAERMITPLEEYGPAAVLVEEDTIVAIGRSKEVPKPEEAEVVDLGRHCLVPGFVDIHIHGGLGKRASEGCAAVEKIAAYLPATGTTSWLPTISAGKEIAGVLEAKERQQNGAIGGAIIEGIHLEGPYLAPKNLPGSAPEDNVPPRPSVSEYLAMWQAAGGQLKLMGLAPELDQALAVIAEMRRTGVVAAIAHSKADYELFNRAVSAGLRHATHTYNVMSGLHHRKPGIVGGVLTNDQVTAELIADGYHVHPAAMEILLRCKGPDKVCLVTDNTQWAGLPDGDYGTVIKENGVVRKKGYGPEVDHTLAGSVWPMNRCVANIAAVLGGCLRPAVQMATLNPARVIGLDGRIGSLEVGKEANFLAVDDEVNVHLAVVKGRVEWQSGQLKMMVKKEATGGGGMVGH